MGVVWVLRVTAMVAVVGGVAMQIALRPGLGAGPVPLIMQVLYFVVPGLTVLGLAEVRCLQLRARQTLAMAGSGRPRPTELPTSDQLTGRLWLVWLLRGLSGLLLAGLILDAATNVVQGITPMIVLMTDSPFLALAAQAAGVAEVLRGQLGRRHTPHA